MCPLRGFTFASAADFLTGRLPCAMRLYDQRHELIPYVQFRLSRKHLILKSIACLTSAYSVRGEPEAGWTDRLIVMQQYFIPYPEVADSYCVGLNDLDDLERRIASYTGQNLFQSHGTAARFMLF